MSRLSKRLGKLQRDRYPADEEAYSEWLPLLLDAYHTVDVGISIEIEDEEKRRNGKVACHKGCGVCCEAAQVPITHLELSGISWYASEKLVGDVRDTVKGQLLRHKEATRCPFVVDSLCSVYPVRPLACRQFFVFGRVCTPGENIWSERRSDVWHHSRALAKRVAMIMLPFYGITDLAKKRDAFENGFMVSAARLMHKLSWEKLHGQMELFENPQ